jgi:Fur family zinc uptake transcriptional regulator
LDGKRPIFHLLSDVSQIQGTPIEMRRKPAVAAISIPGNPASGDASTGAAAPAACLYNRRMKTAKSAATGHPVTPTPATPAADAHDHHAHHDAHQPSLTHGSSQDAALALAEEYCRERGEKLTPIRRKVLELLLNSGRATKAYSLLDEMRQIHPGSAPPTVYRALDFLLSAGLVHRIESINAFTVCHDLTQCQHGILVVCQQCGSVTELHQPKLRQALIAQIEDAGYRLASDEIELKGLCAACQAAKAAGVAAPVAVAK